MRQLDIAQFLIYFLVAISCLRAAEPSASSRVPVKIEKRDESAVRLSFPTAKEQRYQSYVSYDLKDWEFLGNVIKGSDQTITVEHSTKNERAAFFRVETRDTPAPVSSRIERGTNNVLKLKFPTVAGRRYQVYLSGNLAEWAPFGGFVEGNGAMMSVEFDPSEAKEVFFRVESIDVLPLPNMVWIKPGTFVMGSPTDEKDRDLDEDPLTNVVFTHGFWIGKYETTQREYEKVIGNNPSWFQGNPSRPVEQVSWNEAVEYCAKLTQREWAADRIPRGYAYRLPTEAEFEYANRGGTTTRFSYGDDPGYSQLMDYAWYSGNSGNTSHPVGQKKPNPFGLYDMTGNVWEWCLDWYQDPYPGGTQTDPLGPSEGVSRVFRGGGWDYKAASCRCAYRNYVLPSQRSNYVGFRVVLGPALP